MTTPGHESFPQIVRASGVPAPVIDSRDDGAPAGNRNGWHLVLTDDGQVLTYKVGAGDGQLANGVRPRVPDGRYEDAADRAVEVVEAVVRALGTDVTRGAHLGVQWGVGGQTSRAVDWTIKKAGARLLRTDVVAAGMAAVKEFNKQLGGGVRGKAKP